MKPICLMLCCLSVTFISCVGVSMYERIDSAAAMRTREGKKVELTGRISNIPWQHLMGNPFGYGDSYYFDVGNFQIVIYSKEAIACAGDLRVRGMVLKVQGPPKRAGSKVDETHVEYHLSVDEWICLSGE